MPAPKQSLQKITSLFHLNGMEVSGAYANEAVIRVIGVRGGGRALTGLTSWRGRTPGKMPLPLAS